jgi:membrane protein implicated in regulation of membrane protease activity
MNEDTTVKNDKLSHSTLKLITTGYVLCVLALLPGFFGFAFGVAALVVGIVNLTKGSILHGIVQIPLFHELIGIY